jgi:hypothetical protein
VTQRLVDRFQINDLVEVYLTTATGAGWQPGQVVGAEHPGLWVAAAGTFWFVTNGRRIRPISMTEEKE